MKQTFYFSHDYNTRSDEKIKKLIRKHGMIGYGLYWSLIEDLYNNNNELSLDYHGISYDYRVDEDLIESIINSFDLFIINEEIFFSRSVGERLDQRNEKSQKAKESAMKRWGKKSEKNANAMQTHSDSNAIKERKLKENKGKEIKIKDIKKIYTKESFEYMTSRRFLDYHLGESPKVNSLCKRKGEENILQEWSDVVNRLGRIDGFNEKQIDCIIDFIIKDNSKQRPGKKFYWSEQIQSMGKLRKTQESSGVHYSIVMVEEIKKGAPKINTNSNLGVL